MMNTRIRSDNTSGFKGVSWDSRQSRWIATIQKDGRRIWIGQFNDPKSAADAYDSKALELFGAFARPNFLLRKTAPKLERETVDSGDY